MQIIYKIVDKGEAEYFLGVKICRKDNGVFLSQEGYTKKILHKFPEGNLHPVSTPAIKHGNYNDRLLNPRKHNLYRQFVGSLLYLTAKTRPDISAAAGAVSKKVACPNETDWMALIRILQYLK